jgi:hypothetical protein
VEIFKNYSNRGKKTMNHFISQQMCLGWLVTKYVFLVSIGILRLPPPQGMFLTWENKKINMLRNF